MSKTEEGGFFYYLALLIGMVLVGAYLWHIIITPAVSPIFQLVQFMSGLLLVVTSMMFVYGKTRSMRIGMTVASGILGGIHGFLVFVLNDVILGIILFAWISFGILLSFAAYNWLQE
ncbi:MAG: hypothetical protein ACW98Y_04445 [Candidatus Thorarchaeota archaeon]